MVDLEATEKNVDQKGKPLGNVYRRIPVDATGIVDGTGDPKLEGEYDNAVRMIHKLARSERVRQVFVRHVFRYFLGRNEELNDSPTLIAADRSYVESGGSFPVARDQPADERFIPLSSRQLRERSIAAEKRTSAQNNFDLNPEV